MGTIQELLDDWLEQVDEAIEDGMTAAEFLAETKAKISK
jgi:hypothetical protein